MYRWLLCWRYLRTRYIALASVVSVTLGVATLIIVNSVMDGFTTEMQDRMHGILSDIIIESYSANGLPNHESFQERIRQSVGEDLLGVTTVVHVPAMVTINHRGEPITKQLNLIGIDKETYSQVSDFSKYLLHPENREKLTFLLKEGGYAPDRQNFPAAGWEYRRRVAAMKKRNFELQQQFEIERRRNEELRKQISGVGTSPSETNHTIAPPSSGSVVATDGTLVKEPEHGFQFPDFPMGGTGQHVPPVEFSNNNSVQPAEALAGPAFDLIPSRDEDFAEQFDAAKDQHEGIILGISVGSQRGRNLHGEVEDYFYVQPGDDVMLTFPTAGEHPKALNAHFTVVDFYESGMSDYDSTFAFVPIESLQRYRGMIDPASGLSSVTSIQLKLHAGADLNLVRDMLRAQFPMELGVEVNSWRDLQGVLLAAVQMETTILNILLFLIIAVAGFGILATFFMIVVEKTKDIGILKSLGASSVGVASVFLGYGVLLGAFGAGVGAVAGLAFVANINMIADCLEAVTGQEVFDPTVYYFDRIPTIVHPMMVVWVIIGAMLIAVLASVLPSIRAARMHPVEALRYE